MKTTLLNQEQREYICELNNIFNHNWKCNLESILQKGVYTPTQKEILDKFKVHYLQYRKENKSDIVEIFIPTSS